MNLMCFCFLGVVFHGAAAVTHSLKYFCTASSQVPNFPEFMTVGLVDDVQITYYDSIIKEEVPKQDWMKEAMSPQDWETETRVSLNTEQRFKIDIAIAKQRFNQTDGVHVVQWMYGCEWDEDNGEVKGYYQFGYDGEDFIVLNLKDQSWVAPKQQAVITKHKLDSDKAQLVYLKDYFTNICPEGLKKYLNYGRSYLMRTEFPSVSLLQKSSSSPISCHATGFYPNRAKLLWRKDGEEIHEGVEKGQILPNNDGTFQMSVDLQLPSEEEEMQKYECVFQLSGVKEDKITKLDKSQIRTNEESYCQMKVIGGVIVVLVLAVFCCVILCNKRSPDNHNVQEQMFPPEF